MADKPIVVNIGGLDDLRRTLKALPEKIRKQAVRKALREGAKLILSDARANAPVLQIAAPYRQPGTIKRNIVIRASKFARRAGNEGVFVSVRPLRGARQDRLGKAGAKNPNDPFYWWFQEFGYTSGRGKGKKIAGKKFLTAAANSQGEAALQAVISATVPIINKLNTP